MSIDHPEWFAPKRFGYGAGLPIAWQGWAVLAVYIAVVAAVMALASTRPVVIAAVLIPATVTLIVVAARTTRGGWHWNWGRDRSR